MVRIVLLTVALAIGGCSTLPSSEHPPAQRIGLCVDENAMRAQVLHHLSIRMPIEDARAIMEQNGFTGHFGRENEFNTESVFCLVCSQFMPRESWLESLYLSDEIRVFILFEQGKVSDVKVRQISTCI
jgi:hypothetical protein